MKKFLSILLALAVGFTFTFGSAMSAFAADPSTSTTTPQATLDAAYDAAKTELGATKTAVVSKLADKYVENIATGKNVTIAKTVYAQVAEAVYADYMDVLAIKYATLSKGNDANKTAEKLKEAISSESGKEYGALEGKGYVDVASEADFLALVTSDEKTAYLEKTLTLNFDNYKNEVKAELNKIDTSLYTDDVMDNDDPYKTTYKQLAEKTKTDLLNDVEKVTYTLDSTANADARINTVKAAYVELYNLEHTTKIIADVSYVDATNATIVVTYKFVGTNVKGYNDKPILTKKELKGETDKDAATVATLKAKIAEKAAAYYSTAVNAPNATAATIAEAKKVADAYTEVMNCRVENDVTFTAAPEVTNAYLNIKNNYVELADQIAEYKVTVDATGALVYDAAKLDALLEKTKIEMYKTWNGVYNINTFTEGLAAAKIGAEDLDWTKKVAIAILDAEKADKLNQADGTANYYDLEKAKIDAKYDEVIAKVNAATTVAQVEALHIQKKAAGSYNVDTSLINNKTNVVAAIQRLTKFDTVKSTLQKYVDYMNGDTKAWQDGYKAMMSPEDLAKFFAEKGARTNDEIMALVDAAKAECDKLPTNKEAKDAKKAVEDQVAALPSYITAADKDAVTAAWKAVDDFGGAIDNQAKLNNAVTQLKNLEKKAIDDAIKALPALDKVTAADAAAVKAVLDAVDAYESNPMYKTGNDFAVYEEVNAPEKTTAAKYYEAVRKAAKNDVIAAIAALPADATKAQIDAVKAKYDEFVETYTDAEEPYKAADEITNIDKLTYLADKAAEADKLTAEEAKAYVQDLAIAVRTAKSGKKVKVTVNADVQTLIDNGYTVTYKFYKSTKKGSGYKNTVNKTTNTYTNTNPVKGKNYYKVKLVVKNADGTVVATTPLTQCKYGVRTIK